MKLVSSAIFCIGLFAASAASAAPVVIHQFEALALAPGGDRTATVELNDPGNLPTLPHGEVVVRGADGKIQARFDPCKICKYSDTAWSSKSDLAFVAADEKAGTATLYVAGKGGARAVVALKGNANTVRWSGMARASRCS